jgi:hypothetical protein
MEDDGDFDGGDTGDIEVSDTPEEDTSSRGDVEEAVVQQRAARGDPNPRSHDYGNKRGELRGRADAGVGGNYEGLAPYHDFAVRNGRTLQNAVKDWTWAETSIHRNPAAGADAVLRRMGYDPRSVAMAMLQPYASPQANQYAAQQNQNYAYRYHLSEIDRFASDPGNKYFPYVRMTMAQLVQAGRARDLKSAYRQAINMYPQLRAQSRMDRSYAKSDRDKSRAKRFTSYGGY